MSMHYDLISFDLDGTLVDTASEIAEAANLALAEHGIEPRSAIEITHLIGGGTRELMFKLLKLVAEQQPALAQAVRLDALQASMDHHYAVTTGTSAAPYEGACEALALLRAEGVRLACVTNKELRHAQRVLQATRLERDFDLVIGGDSLPHKKPDASVLLHVVAHFSSTAERCAHVGDSRIDVQAARNAGVAAWVVPYGYNAGVPIADARPDRIFQNLLQVAEHVLACRAQASA